MVRLLALGDVGLKPTGRHGANNDEQSYKESSTALHTWHPPKLNCVDSQSDSQHRRTTVDIGEQTCTPVSGIFSLNGRPWMILDEGTGATSSSVDIVFWHQHW